MVPIEHMFLLCMCIEMYANTGRRKMAQGTGGVRPMFSAEKHCKFLGDVRACQATAARQQPLVHAANPIFFSSLTSKVNLFTVIFVCELFAIIGCADEGHSL